MNIKLIALAMIEAGCTKEKLGRDDYYGWSTALLNILEAEYSIESLVRDEILRG